MYGYSTRSIISLQIIVRSALPGMAAPPSSSIPKPVFKTSKRCAPEHVKVGVIVMADPFLHAVRMVWTRPSGRYPGVAEANSVKPLPSLTGPKRRYRGFGSMGLLCSFSHYVKSFLPTARWSLSVYVEASITCSRTVKRMTMQPQDVCSCGCAWLA